MNKILLVALAIIIIIGGYLTYQYYSPTQNPEDTYSFKGGGVENPNEKYGDYFVEIYKNQELIQTVKINDTHIMPSLFIISPNQKYVAFETAAVGGTCVYKGIPLIIDLNDFSIIIVDDFKIELLLTEALGIESFGAVKFSATQYIEEMKWVSDNKINASMRFGDNLEFGCPISYIDKPEDTPNKIQIDIDFALNF